MHRLAVGISLFGGSKDMWANRKGLRQALNLQAALRADYVVDGPLLMDEWGHSRSCDYTIL